MYKSRTTIENILNGVDGRLLCVVGPCSIHNVNEAFTYAQLLKKISDKYYDKLFIVMRTYFEKPRTTIGWKGLINDPDLDNTFNVNKGLEMARKLLLDINSVGLPCGYEVLDSITPQYISDLISWGAIGARTSESQVHRQIVSGLSMPTGFKNGTGGSIKLAIDAIISSNHPHCFMGISNNGESAICKTKGNRYTHIILRGSTRGVNYHSHIVDEVIFKMVERQIKPNIIIDCSHGNSQKDHTKQHIVLESVGEQIHNGNTCIKGIMLESNINSGKQKLGKVSDLQYGVSITDACIDLGETDRILGDMYDRI